MNGTKETLQIHPNVGTNTMTNTILFVLTERDNEMIKELTLPGVIATKIAKGEYEADTDLGTLRASYDSCTEINGALHRKLNAVRRAINADHLVTTNPEDELDD